ncbi:DNA polymerase III subunit chi [Amphibiibacter pelophylacis]|uniref:DNA polymerase III subunit chi n=1 Tax=Amphibiibacter pelophylacis TaxID=1799477 RepID=A0ACC6P492_9BURK
MKIQFYTHRPDPLHYGVRLMDKALSRPDVRLWLYAGPGRATDLAGRLNKIAPERVWPLLRAADWVLMPPDEAQAVLPRSRILLLDALPDASLPPWPPAPRNPADAPLLPVWLNLGWDETRPAAVQALLSTCAARGVQRLLEVVGDAPAALAAARQRWREYREAGHEIEHLVKDSA